MKMMMVMKMMMSTTTTTLVVATTTVSPAQSGTQATLAASRQATH
jgi:hypothetical protein